MKNLQSITLALWLLLAPSALFGQGGNIDLELRVRTNQGQPMVNKPVTFTQLKTNKVITKTTNGSGVIKVLLENGGVWQIGIDKIKNYWFWQIDVDRVPAGRTGEMSKTITYDYDRFLKETMPVPDRSKITFRHINQDLSMYEKPDAQHAIFTLQLLRADKRSPSTNVPVSVVCFDANTIYHTKTDGAGNAVFKLPPCDYAIDVAGIEHFGYVDIDKGNSSHSARLTYEPTQISETTSGDTVFQRLPTKITGTSTHEAIYLTVRGGANGYWQNEPIMLEVIKGPRMIYKAWTDDQGKAKFLLPKGKKYMIHGKFERDIDVVDLTRSRGIGYTDRTITYRPIPKYQYPEQYIPREADLILKSFEDFVQKQLPKPQPGETVKTYAKFGNMINANSEQAILTVGLAGEDYQPDNAGPPLNLSFVIDKSGSMAGYDRIESLREALVNFVDKLRPKDIVSLVTFDHATTVAIPAQAIGNDKANLKTQIALVEADGGTLIYDGMIAGYEQVLKNFKPNYTNRVVLLTDGYGSKPVPEVIAKSKEYNDKGIELSAVGVGDFYNVSMLRLLASHGGGLIEIAKNADDIHTAFVNELSSLLFKMATNVKIEIEYNENLLFAQLYGYPLEEKKPGKVTLKLKNIHSGLDQIGMVKFTLVNPTQAIENQPITIRTKFFDLRTQKRIVREEKIYLKWSPATGIIEYLQERDEKKNYAIAIMNQTLKVMSETFHAGDKKKALQTLERTVQDVKQLFPQADDQDVMKLMEELIEYLDIINRSTKG